MLPPSLFGLVQQFVERTGQLYSLPAAAAEVLRLTSEPASIRGSSKACLESDPALAARILRVVNSSLFGPSRQVTDLNQALTLLGIRPLKMLVLGFSLPKELFAGLEAEVLARYWRSTLIKAIAARELCERLWRIPGDEAFLAGLVQDIGVLALIQRLGPPYQQLLSQVQTQGGSLLDRELDTLGFDHLVLSARLLAHWGLPPGLCAAISVPPDEGRIDDLTKDERRLPRMLHMADLLVRLIEQPFGGALGELLAVGARYCGLTFEGLQPIVESLQKKVEELAEALTLQLPEGQGYVDLLLAAHEQLASESIVSGSLCIAPTTEHELLSLTNNLRTELSRAARHTSPPPTLAASLGATAGRAPSASADGRSIARQTTSATAGLTSSARGTSTNSPDPGLESHVSAAVQRSRQTRRPLTLAFFELDRASELMLELGPAGMTEATYSLREILADWTSQRTEAHLVNDSRLAMLWDDCPRNAAVELARQALAAIRPWSREQFPLSTDLTLSIRSRYPRCCPQKLPVFRSHLRRPPLPLRLPTLRRQHRQKHRVLKWDRLLCLPSPQVVQPSCLPRRISLSNCGHRPPQAY